MKNKYYALETNGKQADIYIFGDITSWEWFENDVSSYTLSKELQRLDPDIETINVHINSYGGEVAEGLAIYNSLRNHKARVRTIVDGFACSIASVIFMAGDERIMSSASLLMIHNAWMYTAGDANQLRKDADDLEKITQATKNAYLEHVNISEEELTKMMDEETWILPDEALEMGFATAIVGETISEKAAASAKKALFNLVKAAAAQSISSKLRAKIVVPEITINQIEELRKAVENINEMIKDKCFVLGMDFAKSKEPQQITKTDKLMKFFNAVIGK